MNVGSESGKRTDPFRYPLVLFEHPQLRLLPAELRLACHEVLSGLPHSASNVPAHSVISGLRKFDCLCVECLLNEASGGDGENADLP